MLKICANGHLTGYRHCGTCGTDEVRAYDGPRRTEVERHAS